MNKKKNRRKQRGIAICALITIGGHLFAHAAEGLASLTISPGFLTIRNIGNSILPSIILQGTSYTINQTLPINITQIKDEKGSTKGYYTTIQSSPLNYTTNTIPANKIFFKSNNTPNFMLGGLDPTVLFGNGIQPNSGSLAQPMTYFYRNNNTYVTNLGQYGDTPTISIEVPANQAGGNYTGKLYYLLFDKSEEN